MMKLRKLNLAVLLALMLTPSVFAGITDTVPAPQPPPGITDTPPATAPTNSVVSVALSLAQTLLSAL